MIRNCFGLDFDNLVIPIKEVGPVIDAKRMDGQGLVEYALIILLVALVIIVILTLLGPQIANVFSKVVDAFNNA